MGEAGTQQVQMMDELRNAALPAYPPPSHNVLQKLTNPATNCQRATHPCRGRGSEGYYDVDPAVVLAYIAQHWEWARTRLFNGTEGILTLMSQLALAALQRPATAGGAAGLARLRELFLEVEGKLATLPGNACTKLCTQSPQVVAALQAVGSALGRAVAA